MGGAKCVGLTDPVVGAYREEKPMDPLMGTIILFAGNFAPKGWAYCDGSLKSISHNEALFSIFGTIYGGDGTSNFALPDLRSKVPVPGANYIIAVEGVYPSRE
jgi:microcystin-dependent protein